MGQSESKNPELSKQDLYNQIDIDKAVKSTTETRQTQVDTKDNEVKYDKKVIYVLSLNNNKYYVGVTSNLDQRIIQHKNKDNCSAEWVKLHGYKSLIMTMPLIHELDEDNEVKKLIMKYGINNVRGGSYSSIILREDQINLLNKEFSHARNECFKCGNIGHYAKDCVAMNNKKDSVNCNRCGRSGHYKNVCKAKKLLLNNICIDDLNYCARCGRKNHSNENYSSYQCTYKTDRNKKLINREFCEKCGRDSHSILKCYAKTTYDGNFI
jgi:predicted GIY-YIG superfamily endonuclease